MTDYGASYTDKKIAKLDAEIQSIYKEAGDDIDKKMKSFVARSEAKEKKYAQKVANGEMTQKEFDRWKSGQVFQGKQWQAKKDEILETMHQSNVIATNLINNEGLNVFAANANYMAYDLEHGVGINFGFTLYDSNTVSNLIKNDPQLLPKWKVNEQKDYTWSQKKLNRSITQGIIQGESLEKIAAQLSDGLESQNKNKMRTFARTAMTGAQNSGRQMQLVNAKKMGIDCLKEWMATLDAHTRDSHKDLDGEQVEVEKEFSNHLMYPGDPSGAPAEVYNCRCTMVSEIKKYPSVYNRYNNETGERIKNMSYRDWESAKKTGKDLAPYDAQTISLKNLFDKLTQNGAYEKIKAVNTTLANQFYKELQNMGEQAGGLKPSAIWKAYQKGELPEGVSADKLESIMKQYKDKAGKTLVNAKEVLPPVKINYSEFGGEKAFNILAKYENLDDLLLNGTNEEFKYLIGDAFKGKNSELTPELFAKAKSAQNGVSGPAKAPKTKPKAKPIPKATDGNTGRYGTTSDWIAAAENNPDIPGMLEIEKTTFTQFSSAETEALKTYTGSAYTPMNNYLRSLAAGMSERDAIAYSRVDPWLVEQIDYCKEALSGVKLDRDMVLRRGTDLGDLAGLFMQGDFSDNKRSLQNKSVSELNDMFQGMVGQYAGFTSTSSQWNRGFTGNVEIVIDAPAGTNAASIMGISQYGTAEGETLLNANTKVACEKIEKSDGHMGSDIRVFLRIIN